MLPLLLLLLAASPVAQAQSDPDAMAAAACGAMNMTAKLGMMRGYGTVKAYSGYSRNSGCGGVCGRPSSTNKAGDRTAGTFRWDNGPQGFGDHTVPGTTTQWPSTLNMASTFDPALALEWGTAMGEEFWGKGTNIQEGPGINIARVMKNGRNFEYVSGEDPVLGSIMVAPIVTGIQKNVMSISKHYIMNNQEYDRTSSNEVVDEKTLMELYVPPFGAAAKANTSGFMCSYNLINGIYACGNNHTLNTILKGYYDYKGFVVSDWGACHATDYISAGMDIEMPDASNLQPDKIKAGIASGMLTEAMVDESCHRILRSYFSVPEDKRIPGPCGGGDCINKKVKTAAHVALARKLSAMSTVLLKNEGGLLPLSKNDLVGKKIVLIGTDGGTDCYTGGSGSGAVSDHDKVCPIVAMKALGLDVTSVTDAEDAVAAAKAADLAIVFGSAHTGEGHDRDSLDLEGDIDELIPSVAAVQPKTIVVLSVPGSILTPWRESVPAILWNGLPGEQVGPALGDILFGVTPPQAKLPVTQPLKDNDQGFTVKQYPGIDCKKEKCTGTNPAIKVESTYSEGQIVGYRWYDKHKVFPAYSFGHGLTYGNHSLSGLKVSGRTVSFTLTRTAGVGCETPQVYIGYPSASVDPTVPTKVMRYFKKSCEATEQLSYTMTDQDVSNWDVESKQWTVTKGDYKVYVGVSSQDIRLTGSMTVV